jgi:hypothetical protein
MGLIVKTEVMKKQQLLVVISCYFQIKRTESLAVQLRNKIFKMYVIIIHYTVCSIQRTVYSEQIVPISSTLAVAGQSRRRLLTPRARATAGEPLGRHCCCCC